MTLPVPVPRPSYSQARENLVKAIPPQIICLLGCGGRDCRYEGPACWRTSQQAIRGIFSSWVTNDIIAMARPSTRLIERYNIIKQFQRHNIKSMINMQLPGEHAHCGPDLDPESGFSYSPQLFMDNKIYFYNFGMPDYGVSSLSGMLDVVKVLAFAVKQGRVAVHCHAGLGRTGVLIACYLVYVLRISPSEAVHYVRIKRPRSIQTRAQINIVFSFARLLATQLVLFPDLSLRHGAPFGLQQFLHRQSLLLHGEEGQRLKQLPKLVDFLCKRLASMAWGHTQCHSSQTELEKRAAVLELTKVVRETLVKKKFLPILRDPGYTRNSSFSSVSSWDEPEGFLERKQEILLNKRCYSDSDLSKMAILEDLELVQYPPPLTEGTKDSALQKDIVVQEVTAEPVPTTFRIDCKNAKVGGIHFPGTCSLGQGSGVKKAMCMRKKGPLLTKFTSNRELDRNQNSSQLVLLSQALAKAMAEQDPPGEGTLQRAALLQEELNMNECGWAMLALESDPSVLSCLLWNWLEKLREPILEPEDVQIFSLHSGGGDTLSLLCNAKKQTISCLLGCIGQVTTLCPRLEDSVLCRLIRALTRCPQDEVLSYGWLVNLYKDIVKEMRQHDLFLRTVGRSSKRLITKKQTREIAGENMKKTQ